MSPDPGPIVGPGGIRFYDAYVPAADVGNYRIDLRQSVTPPGQTPEVYTVSQVFSVGGPRWSLPANEVFSTFPAPEAVGAFGQSFPHVVFSSPALPWERDAFAGTEPDGRAPWVALLLFTVGEQIGGADALLSPPTTISVGALFAGARSHGTVLWPDITQEWYEQPQVDDPTATCSVIDLSPAAFSALVPGRADLPYLTHARQVDPTAKDADALRISGDGWYSVAIGGRLPAAGTTALRHTAHLVSLEGFSEYAGHPVSALSGFERVRMISLHSWAFTCAPAQAESFATLVDGLLATGDGTPKPTALKLPLVVPDDADADTLHAATVLDRGYVPLRYDTRPGERTFGWYRGPLSPVAVTRYVADRHHAVGDPTGWEPARTASATLVYDTDRGVFDLSYAIAWETGRAMALADGAFSRALVDWRRQGHRLVDMIVERRATVPELAGFDPEAPAPNVELDLLSAVRAYAVTDDFMSYLVTQLAGELDQRPGTAPPATPDPAFPAYVDPPTGDPATIKGMLAEPVMQAALRAAAGQQLEGLADWVARRYLLTGVPFSALIAQPELLPAESIRFFHLDANWLDALVEGALSVGIESSRDLVYQDLVKSLILETAMGGLAAAREALLNQPPSVPDPVTELPELAGMLLRSALVPGWPGLEVRAFADANCTVEIPLLRMERLSAGVLLCLWPEVPVAVAVDEPREGIAFGVEDAKPPATGDCVNLRSVADPGYGTLTGGHVDGVTVLDANRRIVILGPEGALAKMCAALPGMPALAPRDFAVQMIKVPERGLFVDPSPA